MSFGTQGRIYWAETKYFKTLDSSFYSEGQYGLIYNNSIMKYLEALRQLGKNYDPFLHIQKEEIVDESKNFFVIAARAPYAENHLLIIPKKKVYLLKDLNGAEKEEMRELLEKWTKNLHKKHKDVNLLLRDGLTGGNIGKSVNHLHFHLIPDCPIGAENSFNVDDRERLDDESYIENTNRIKKIFLPKQ